MLDYIPFPLKMEWLFFAVYTFTPMIFGSIADKIIKKKQKERIERKLAALNSKQDG